MRILIAAVAATIATSAAGAASIINGNFESGNTGFTSAYTFIPVGAESQMGEAKYSVATNALATHTSFASYGDHTSSSGQYLVVNGSGTPNTIVWMSSPIAVTQGRYNFGAFLSTAFATSPALLQFTAQPNIGSAISLGNFAPPAVTGIWRGVGSDLLVAAGVTSVTLSIVNQNTDFQGNDFGIDDITLSAVPEPGTWGLLIAGFVMVGVVARRRRGAVAA